MSLKSALGAGYSAFKKEMKSTYTDTHYSIEFEDNTKPVQFSGTTVELVEFLIVNQRNVHSIHQVKTVRKDVTETIVKAVNRAMDYHPHGTNEGVSA